MGRLLGRYENTEVNIGIFITKIRWKVPRLKHFGISNILRNIKSETSGLQIPHGLKLRERVIRLFANDSIANIPDVLFHSRKRMCKFSLRYLKYNEK